MYLFGEYDDDHYVKNLVFKRVPFYVVRAQ